MYTITINNMKFYSYNGCLQEERTLGQPLEVDLTFYLKPELLDLQDNVVNTVNYAEAYQLITKIIQQSQFNLIESLALKILQQCKIQFAAKVDKVAIKIRKYSVPIAGIFDHIEIGLEL